MVSAELQKKFPDTKFNFINAGIGSTASITGAFRFQDDVLSHGSIDLLFLEFAVNDNQDAHYTKAECIRGMEGILRHLWLTNPNADVVVTYFVNPEMLKDFDKNIDPLSSASHEIVLEKYGVSGVELNREVSDRIKAGKLTFKEYGGVHPNATGNQLGANMIVQLLNKAWETPLAVSSTIKPHALPEPIDPNSYFSGHFVGIDQANITSGWQIEVPDWKSIGGNTRARFNNQKLLCATTPGAELTLPFSGKAIGIYLLAGPDAGILEVSIDGGPAKPFDLMFPFSKGLHYPCSIVFDGDLPPGPHKLDLRLTGDKNAASQGTAARILDFCVN